MLTTPFDVTLRTAGLVLKSAEQEVYLNYYWLRDNCASSFDPEVNERTFDITALARPPVAKSAQVSGGDLDIVWCNEDHTSTFSIETLVAFGTGKGRPDPAVLSRNLWRAGYSDSFQRFSQHDVMNDMQARTAWAKAMITDGIAVITDMGDSDAALTDLANCLGLVRPSVAGDYFEVKVHIAPVNLAFTANALEMHTDTPAEEFAPGVQFLHCRQNTVDGGYSLFLDGAAVAEDFRRDHPEEFALLSTHKIPFYYDHDDFDWRSHQHVIELDATGAVSGLTVSQHMADAFDLPQDTLDAYYPAFCMFLKTLNGAKYLNRFRMKAGECFVFDNHRIVHGREAYTASSGDRYLRGCYIDRGELRSSYRALVKKSYA
jgi:gamma-butyrobetaine dioxygenase